ncbi:hypothetical protein C8R45DRAFT_363353 [Mycena sanguinolenta]|nr:hypothetical protein C8R45DRAFT_363353 [Mycena sanguinolenta]
MSVDELRARIVQLDSEIELQKKLLEQLEKDKILVRRQLNAVLDPMARLPLEISSDILLRFHTSHRGVPSVLLKICTAWTDIALATPALWTGINIEFPCRDNFAKVLPIWFQRARSRPLSICIELSGPSSNWNHRVSDVLWTHGGQLKHFEILPVVNDLDQSDESESETQDIIDLFGDMTPLSLPLLETVTIRSQHEYIGSQIFDLLRGASNIVEVVFDSVINLHDPDIIVVPTLRRLIFGEAAYSDDEILRYLALPALEALSLPMFFVSRDDLVAWVERSAAPLCDLALGCGRLDSLQLHECLGLIPTLTRLKMWKPSADVVTGLFTALADTPSLLPNLRDLTIHILTGNDYPLSDSSWRNLVRALSTRRLKQLYIVPVAASPPTDVLDSLRQLVAAGANIHVGTEERNHVAA